jgi:hypothetical protein
MIPKTGYRFSGQRSSANEIRYPGQLRSRPERRRASRCSLVHNGLARNAATGSARRPRLFSLHAVPRSKNSQPSSSVPAIITAEPDASSATLPLSVCCTPPTKMPASPATVSQNCVRKQRRASSSARGETARRRSRALRSRPARSQRAPRARCCRRACRSRSRASRRRSAGKVRPPHRPDRFAALLPPVRDQPAGGYGAMDAEVSHRYSEAREGASPE